MANSFSGLTAYVNEDRFGRAFWTEALMRNDVMPFVVKDGLPIPGVKNDSIDLAKLSATATIADGSTCVGDLDKDNDTVISKGTTINLKKGFMTVSRPTTPRKGCQQASTTKGLAYGRHL